jgi:hypothetical protein
MSNLTKTAVQTSSKKLNRVYDSVDYDYPMCGGYTIDQVGDSATYIVTHESNMTGQRSGQKNRITLSRPVEMDEKVYETNGGETCTIADVLICNELGSHGRDYLADIGLSIVEDTQISSGHTIR